MDISLPRSLGIDLIYCGDGNPRLLSIAREEGWHLGFRSDGSFTLDNPLFIDIDYKKPDWQRHLDMVAKYRPKYATIPDLSEQQTSVSDIERALKQAGQLAPYCKTVLLVPKLSAQLALLPPDIAIGYSIPSSYGGAQYLPWELSGRRVHLLGGSPKKQMQHYLHLSSFAKVLSADGNYAQKMAIRYGEYWRKNTWIEHPGVARKEKNIYLECWRWSCRNLLEAWKKLA